MNCLLNRLNNFAVTNNNIHLLRFRHTKHWNPKYKKERKEKVLKLMCPTPNLYNISDNYKRTKLKFFGIYPHKPWVEKSICVSCTESVFEPYIPPEGDGKFSSLSTIGAKQNAEYLVEKTKSYQAILKIKKYEEEFNINEFSDRALDIYIKTHEALARKQNCQLRTFITEKLFPEILYNVKNKMLTWKFIKLIEPPKVVHSRCTSFMTDDNVFAQLTVRLHTEQILAVHDRFGRLIHGSEILKKDVLDYIVFEKHLSNEYGLWRLHSKIVPLWMPSQQFITKTFVIH